MEADTTVVQFVVNHWEFFTAQLAGFIAIVVKIFSWANKRHAELRRSLLEKVEKAEEKMGKRITELRLVVDNDSDNHRAHVDAAKSELHRRVDQKVDKDHFHTVTERLFDLFEETRSTMLQLMADLSSGKR